MEGVRERKGWSEREEGREGVHMWGVYKVCDLDMYWRVRVK